MCTMNFNIILVYEIHFNFNHPFFFVAAMSLGFFKYNYLFVIIITTKQHRGKCYILMELLTKWTVLLAILLKMFDHISLESYRRFWHFC